MRRWAATAAVIGGLAVVVSAETIPAQGGNIELTPMAHAHVQIEYAGKVIQIDPSAQANLASAKPADLVLITDIHGDHMDPPSIAIGVPIGGWLIHRIRPETFRRVCMSFDAWVVGFGLSTLLKDLHLVADNRAYLLLAAVAVLDSWLLYRFFALLPPAEPHAIASVTAETTVAASRRA